MRFRIESRIPLSGGLGSSAAAIVAGLLAADHMFELDADVLRLATELEGHPDNVAAALNGGCVVCVDGRVHRLEPPPGIEGVLLVPHAGVRTSEARAALPESVPIGDAVANLAHIATLMLGLTSGDPELIAAGLSDRLHEPHRARLYPRAAALRARAAELGALGASMSGAGPAVLFWCQLQQTGIVTRALRAEAEGWADVIRAPFESEGADVREL
jgi:homoserine kinase